MPLRSYTRVRHRCCTLIYKSCKILFGREQRVEINLNYYVQLTMGVRVDSRRCSTALFVSCGRESESRGTGVGSGTRSYLNSLCNVALSKQDAINYTSYTRAPSFTPPTSRRRRVTSLSSSPILPLSFERP